MRAEHFQRLLTRVPDMREMIEALQRSRIVYSFMVFSGVFTSKDTEESTRELCALIASHVKVKSEQAGTVLAPTGKANINKRKHFVYA